MLPGCRGDIWLMHRAADNKNGNKAMYLAYVDFSQCCMVGSASQNDDFVFTFKRLELSLSYLAIKFPQYIYAYTDNITRRQ